MATMNAESMHPDVLPDIAELESMVYDRHLLCETVRGGTGKECGQPAAWRVVMSCCAHVGFVCEGHWSKFSTALPRIYLIGCRYCDRRFIRFSDAVADARRV